MVIWSNIGSKFIRIACVSSIICSNKVSLELHALHKECISLIFSLRPRKSLIIVIQRVFQFPCSEVALLEIRVAIMCDCSCALIQCALIISRYDNIERMIGTTTLGIDGSGYVIRDAVLLTCDELSCIA